MSIFKCNSVVANNTDRKSSCVPSVAFCRRVELLSVHKETVKKQSKLMWLHGEQSFTLPARSRGALLLLLHRALIPTKYPLKTRGSIFTSGCNLAQVWKIWAPNTHRVTLVLLCSSALCQQEHIPTDGFTQSFWLDVISVSSVVLRPEIKKKIDVFIGLLRPL